MSGQVVDLRVRARALEQGRELREVMRPAIEEALEEILSDPEYQERLRVAGYEVRTPLAIAPRGMPAGD